MSITSPVFLSVYLPIVPLGLLLLQRFAPNKTILRKLWILFFNLTFLVLSDLSNWWIPASLTVAAWFLPKFGRKGCILLIVCSILVLLCMKLLQPDSWPVGLSFVSLQVITVAVEIMSGCQKPGLLDTAVFLTFYPKLSAGPLDRFSRFNADLNKARITADDLEQGLTRMAIGLAKKLLIADKLSPVLQACYTAKHPFLSITAMVLAPTVLYFDFSGYADMACGIAWMIGLHLPENFDHPFQADSIRNFWKRWHITLSRFLMEYVYFPLGGSRKGINRTSVNLLIVFLISGLWHGVTACYLLFGLCHALFVIAQHRRWLRPEAWHPILRKFYVFLGISLPFVIFMAPTLSAAGQCAAGFFDWTQPLTACNPVLLLMTTDRILALAAAILSFPLSLGWMRISSSSAVRRTAVVIMLIVCYACALAGGYSLPLYARF